MTDKGVNDFIEKLGWIYTNQDYEHSGPESQEEADFVTLMYEMRANLPKELHPTVNANAIRRSTGKQLTPRAYQEHSHIGDRGSNPSLPGCLCRCNGRS